MSRQLDFVQVPSRCPLPAACVVCGQNPTGNIPLKGFEGIPLLLTLHLTVHLPICRTHAQRFRLLNWQQSGLTCLTALLLVAGFVVGFMAEHVIPYTVAGFLLATVSGYFSAKIYGKLDREFGMRLKTLGNYPAYRLYVRNPEWNAALLELVAKYQGKEVPGSK
ncbi:hypothetical protein BH09VER1_BH09VER1_35480 [soil metagenome]